MPPWATIEKPRVFRSLIGNTPAMLGMKKLEPPSRGGKELVVPDVIRRNTRSIRLNLKKSEAREVFEKLVATVDVVVEGFRPGVASRLGLDYDTLARIKKSVER